MNVQPKLATVANAVANAPVVSPLAELLQHRTTIVIVVGIVALLGLPYVPNMTPDRLTLLTNVIIGAMGLLGVRFSIEGVMTTRADLKTLVDDVQGSIQVDTPSASVTVTNNASEPLTRTVPPPAQQTMPDLSVG